MPIFSNPASVEAAFTTFVRAASLTDSPKLRSAFAQAHGARNFNDLLARAKSAQRTTGRAPRTLTGGSDLTKIPEGTLLEELRRRETKIYVAVDWNDHFIEVMLCTSANEAVDYAITIAREGGPDLDLYPDEMEPLDLLTEYWRSATSRSLDVYPVAFGQRSGLPLSQEALLQAYTSTGSNAASGVSNTCTPLEAARAALRGETGAVPGTDNSSAHRNPRYALFRALNPNQPKTAFSAWFLAQINSAMLMGGSGVMVNLFGPVKDVNNHPAIYDDLLFNRWLADYASPLADTP